MIMRNGVINNGTARRRIKKLIKPKLRSIKRYEIPTIIRPIALSNSFFAPLAIEENLYIKKPSTFIKISIQNQMLFIFIIINLVLEKNKCPSPAGRPLRITPTHLSVYNRVKES